MDSRIRLARCIRLALLAQLALLAGCATRITSLDVKAPSPAPASTIRSQTVMIRDVTDARVFAESPAPGGTPSLTEEAEESGASGTQSRAIGRVRDGFGKEKGTVLLPPGKTVDALVRQTLANTLQGMGYQLESDETALSSNDIVMDVTIDKFWGWVDTDGGMTLNGELVTTIQTTGPLGKKKSATVETKYRRRVGLRLTPERWLVLYGELLNDYQSVARRILTDLPKP